MTNPRLWSHCTGAPQNLQQFLLDCQISRIVPFFPHAFIRPKYKSSWYARAFHQKTLELFFPKNISMFWAPVFNDSTSGPTFTKLWFMFSRLFLSLQEVCDWTCMIIWRQDNTPKFVGNQSAKHGKTDFKRAEYTTIFIKLMATRNRPPVHWQN